MRFVSITHSGGTGGTDWGQKSIYSTKYGQLNTVLWPLNGRDNMQHTFLINGKNALTRAVGGGNEGKGNINCNVRNWPQMDRYIEKCQKQTKYCNRLKCCLGGRITSICRFRSLWSHPREHHPFRDIRSLFYWPDISHFHFCFWQTMIVIVVGLGHCDGNG